MHFLQTYNQTGFHTERPQIQEQQSHAGNTATMLSLWLTTNACHSCHGAVARTPLIVSHEHQATRLKCTTPDKISHPLKITYANLTPKPNSGG